MKVLVAHPGKQHVYRLINALQKADYFDCFVTTAYYKPGTITSRIISFLPSKIKNKALHRREKLIDDDSVIVECEFLGLMCTFFAKIPGCRWFYNILNNYMNDRFGRKVAKIAIERNVDAVISFDNNSMVLFETLKKKKPDIIRILDTSIASREYLKSIYEKDINEFNDNGLYKEQKVIWNKKYMSRITREINASQYYLAGSSFVKDSLIFSGANPDKISVVHYGVDTKQFSSNNSPNDSECLNLIYVGGISYRKGLHHLLSVMVQLADYPITLSLAGDYNKKMILYKKYCCYSNINFLGFLSHDELAVRYKQSDAFVLSSLGEGMAMVGLEAMSSGLPVICSKNTGLTDVVVDGENGYVFEAGNDDQLKKLLIELINRKSDLFRMGRKARSTAQKYTWDFYSDNLIKTIKKWENNNP